MKLNQHVEIDDQFLTGSEASTLAGRPQSYREKQVGMIKAKPGVKLIGHIYKRCRQAEETCKAGRETSRQAEESEASIDLVGLQDKCCRQAEETCKAGRGPSRQAAKPALIW